MGDQQPNHVVKVPDVGEGIAEVELVSWSVAVGDVVSRNQILAEVMTDKANVEIPSPVDGTVAAISGDVGTILAVGSPLVELSGSGGALGHLDAPTGAAVGSGTGVDPATGAVGVGNGFGRPEPKSLAHSVEVNAPTESATPPVAPTPEPEPGDPMVAAEAQPLARGRALASPAVRHRAREAGIDLRQVGGSGPAGRITHEDLDLHRSGQGGGAAFSPGHLSVGRAVPDESVVQQPIIGIRRRIAQRMVAATQSVPHITYVEEVDMTSLEALRAEMNEGRPQEAPRLTVLPFLMRAIVHAVKEHPNVNAHVDDDGTTMSIFGGVHIGIATQTANGLLVPVVRHAEARTIWSLASAVNELADTARAGRSAPSDLSGSTITISSLGSLGGLVTTPIINRPEVAIVGVNKIATRPMWHDGAFIPRSMMNLSSSFDHRIVDGWDAASFVQAIRRGLEQPAWLFMDES